MGYCMSQVGASFQIKAERKAAALKAAQALAPVGAKEGGGGHYAPGKPPVHFFSWMNNVDLATVPTLEEMLSEWRYPSSIDAAGNIIAVHFRGEKIGDEIYLWRALAPYVEPGSFIEMLGEDGARWRWTFDGRTCREVQAVTTWPER